MSGVTDPYQPVERKARITRGCLEVLADFGHPVIIITKNSLVKRDVDLLKRIANKGGCVVYFGLTSLDRHVAGIMEPRASRPEERLKTITSLSKEGIPVGVLIAPVVPAITDHEIPSLLNAARDHGASFAGYVILRLPYGVKDIFSRWLDQHFPDRKDKVLNRVRNLRGGELNNTEFFNRMKGQGAYADYVRQIFAIHARRTGLDRGHARLTTAHFRRPLGAQNPDQACLWDDM
jgi:DNA repair photolyase